jgi:hypothetical protein
VLARQVSVADAAGFAETWIRRRALVRNRDQERVLAELLRMLRPDGPG